MSDRDKAFGYAVSKWGTSNTPARENLAFADGWKAALDWTMTTTPSPISPVKEFEALCDLIPEDAYWGMPLTPDLVRHIRDCYTAPTTGSAPVAVKAFGTGAQVVIEGMFDGEHAVLILPAKQPGEVGASAKREGPITDDSLIDAVVLTFPTAEQVERVANALVAASPAASVLTD